ncbi:MAG: hypothetical protein HC846_03795, partial [Blastocatellia bacterium]|nr:hypothetical protein [Blastocatellia bacterium]
MAQSGRRISNPPPTPKVETTPEPTPTPQPKEDIKPEYSIIVVSNVRSSMNSNSTFRNPENAYSWVLERLRSSSHLEVRYGGESNMKKATEIAKNSTESYVLLVELSEDNFAGPTMGNSTV